MAAEPAELSSPDIVQNQTLALVACCLAVVYPVGSGICAWWYRNEREMEKRGMLMIAVQVVIFPMIGVTLLLHHGPFMLLSDQHPILPCIVRMFVYNTLLPCLYLTKIMLLLRLFSYYFGTLEYMIYYGVAGEVKQSITQMMNFPQRLVLRFLGRIRTGVQVPGSPGGLGFGKAGAASFRLPRRATFTGTPFDDGTTLDMFQHPKQRMATFDGSLSRKTQCINLARPVNHISDRRMVLAYALFTAISLGAITVTAILASPADASGSLLLEHPLTNRCTPIHYSFLYLMYGMWILCVPVILLVLRGISDPYFIKKELHAEVLLSLFMMVSFSLRLHNRIDAASLRTAFIMFGVIGYTAIGVTLPSLLALLNRRKRLRLLTNLSRDAFRLVLEEPRLWKNFKQELGRRFCLEYALFIEEYHTWQCHLMSITDERKRCQLQLIGMRCLADQFIRSCSTNELNIPGTMRNEVLRCLDSPETCHVRSMQAFDAVYSECLQIMYHSLFPSFVRNRRREKLSTGL